MIYPETLEIAHHFIGSPPLFSYNIAGTIPCRIERFICKKVRGTLPAMSNQIIGAQFSGAKVYQDTKKGQELASYGAVTSIFPIDQESQFHITGNVDFAIIYIDDLDSEEHRESQELLTLLAQFKSFITFQDPLLSALTRQLLSCLASQSSSEDHLNILSNAFFSQLKYVLTDTSGDQFHSSTHHLNKIHRITAYINQHLGDDLSLNMLADLVDLSEPYLRKIFQQTAGITLHQYVLTARISKAQELLLHTDLAISKISEDTGFSSQSHLTSCFKKVYDMPPLQYRQQIKK